MTRADKLLEVMKENWEEFAGKNIFDLMKTCCPCDFDISERGCEDEESCFDCWMKGMEDTEVRVDKLMEAYCVCNCGKTKEYCKEQGDHCDDFNAVFGYLKGNEKLSITAEDAKAHTITIPNSVKDKEGKPQMRLILPHAAEALVRIREYGLKKYPQADNWKSVPKEDWTDAMFRHLMKYIGGEETDEESGMPHLWHALCNLSYLIELDWKENAK